MTETISYYTVSRNYDELFDAVSQGIVIAGFVDFSFSGQTIKSRDICMIKRSGPYDIFIGVRGTQYEAIYPFMSNEGPEILLFKKACEMSNLEWIKG